MKNINNNRETIELLKKHDILSEKDIERFEKIILEERENLTIQESLSKFEEQLKLGKKAQKTINDYLFTVESYFEFVNGSKGYENVKLEEEQMDNDKVELFLIQLYAEKGTKQASIMKSFSILNNYREFLNNIYGFNVNKYKINNDDFKTDNSIYVVNEEEFNTIVKFAKDERYEFVLWSMYYLGLNRNTAIDMKMGDIDTNKKIATVPNVNSGYFEVELNEEFLARFEEYKFLLLEENQKSINIKLIKKEKIDITTNPLEEYEPLYPSNRWKRISLATLNRAFNLAIKNYIKVTKAEEISLFGQEYMEDELNDFTISAIQDSRRYGLKQKNIPLEKISKWVNDTDEETTLLKLRRSKEIFKRD